MFLAPLVFFKEKIPSFTDRLGESAMLMNPWIESWRIFFFLGGDMFGLLSDAFVAFAFVAFVEKLPMFSSFLPLLFLQ